MRRTDFLFIGFGLLWIILFGALVFFDRDAGTTAATVAAAEGDAGRAPAARPAQGVELAVRPADAPRAAPAPASRFAFLRYNIDVSEAAPRACLTFSAPLDPAADYAPYVALEPAAPIALSVSGQTLCIGGLQFGEQRELVLRQGLPAADGRSLATDERTPIDFGDRPAFVSFAGDGVILPRRDADGLAIETVNVDVLQITVSRVNDRAIVFKRITAGTSVGEGDYGGYLYDDEDPWNVGETVWRGEMEIAGERNAPTTTVFPLAEAIGRLEPGAYFIEAVQKKDGESWQTLPASARRWILFTDLALTTYRGGDGLDVVLRSLQTARPLQNAELQLLAYNNEVLATARSDRSGRVHFDGQLLRGEGNLAPRLITAYSLEGDFAALDLESAPVDLSGEGVDGRRVAQGADVFIYLDRGVYRPGETVRASALIRDAEVDAMSRPGSFVVYRPNGIEAERVRFEEADDAPPGAAFHDYEVPRDAARGMWRIALELDGLGEVASEPFSVEDFVPQRIAVELTADEDTPILAGEIRGVEANARFLYGAPGAGLAVEGEARVAVDPSPFDSYPDYVFGRHDEQFAEERIDLPPAVADGAGNALIALDLQGRGEYSTQPLRVTAVVGVEEPGGRVVRDSVIVPYRPRPLYLGLDPLFDGDSAPRSAMTGFNVVALNSEGRAAAADVEWRLLRIDWDYDWWRDEYGQWRWRQTRNVVELETGVEQILENGIATIEIGDLDWGDYELIVTDPETGAEASRGFWAGWGGRTADGVEAPDRVRVTAPTDPVVIGESAEFSILPPYAGEAEIVVATDRVLASQSVTVPEEGASVSFDVTEEWGAGAYVMVSVFTPRDPVAMPQPRRAVGVVYAPVDVTSRTFEVALEAPDVVRPRQTLEVTVRASGAQAGDDAWVTLAAVDEGILQLTRFESPDADGWYFGKKMLGVELRDDYGRLLDPNQGAAAPVRAGGDQLGGEGLTVTPTRTVALFSGPVKLDPDGSAAISLDLPDFNGELRLMAVAWSGDAVGDGARPLTVRDPVPAELILPRFLAPDDEAIATATVDNVEGAGGAYSILVSSDGLEVSDIPITAELAPGERRDLPASIGAVEEGVNEVDLSVSGPGGFAIQRSYPIQTRSPYLPARIVERDVMEAGETYAPTADLLASFAPGSGEVTVSFSPIPLDAAALYASLEQYPYGCTEQTVSRALPLLYAAEMAALADIEQSGQAQIVLQEAVSTILNRQNTDGTIGLWSIGDRGASPWLGAYATDFLSRAKAAGYVVPDMALDRALQALQRIADGDLSGGGGYDYEVFQYRGQTDNQALLLERARAYALYVLAREGRVNVASLRYVHDQELNQMQSPLARAQIAAALAFIGDRARSANAFEAAVDAIGYVNSGDYYQTPRRDLAGVLALASEAGQSELVETLAQQVAEELPEPDRLSTQEKAFLLVAAHAMLAGRDGAEIAADGAVPSDAAASQSDRYTLSLADLQNGVTFENAGTGQVWRTVVARGAPVTAPPEAAEGVAVEKAITRLDGSDVDTTQLAQGDRLLVAITLRPLERRLQPLIVADLLPAGFEIEAVLRPSDGGDQGAYGFLGEIAQTKIAEARDDRYLAAIDATGQEVTIGYIVRAVTAGSFAAPGAVVEDMYRADVFARSPAFEVDIAARS